MRLYYEAALRHIISTDVELAGIEKVMKSIYKELSMIETSAQVDGGSTPHFIYIKGWSKLYCADRHLSVEFNTKTLAALNPNG